jgi:hypothetical protein
VIADKSSEPQNDAMHSNINHIAQILLRITAGLIAALCFYLAFFLYEDEDGIYQNQIDNLWAAVYDRAEVTKSTSTALFNKIGELLRNSLNFLFGERLLSLQAVVVSINLSWLGSLIIYLKRMGWHHHVDRIMLAIALLLFALLPAISKRRWAALVSMTPILWLESTIAINLMGRQELERTIAIQIALVLSYFSDYLAIVLLRKLFASITKLLSLPRIFLMISILSLFAMLLSFFPLWFIPQRISGRYTPNPIRTFIGAVYPLNLITTFLCALPAFLLALLLLHRIAWPILSRLLSPLKRFKIVTNRKALVTIGSLCATFAFGLARVGAKDLLEKLDKLL